MHRLGKSCERQKTSQRTILVGIGCSSPDVGCVIRNVELGGWVKIILGTWYRRHYTLVMSPELPPGCVVLLWWDVAPEYTPSPLVN
jgi:hypothetical protein